MPGGGYTAPPGTLPPAVVAYMAKTKAQLVTAPLASHEANGPTVTVFMFDNGAQIDTTGFGKVVSQSGPGIDASTPTPTAVPTATAIPVSAATPAPANPGISAPTSAYVLPGSIDASPVVGAIARGVTTGLGAITGTKWSVPTGDFVAPPAKVFTPHAPGNTRAEELAYYALGGVTNDLVGAGINAIGSGLNAAGSYLGTPVGTNPNWLAADVTGVPPASSVAPASANPLTDARSPSEQYVNFQADPFKGYIDAYKAQTGTQMTGKHEDPGTPATPADPVSGAPGAPAVEPMITYTFSNGQVLQVTPGGTIKVAPDPKETAGVVAGRDAQAKLDKDKAVIARATLKTSADVEAAKAKYDMAVKSAEQFYQQRVLDITARGQDVTAQGNALSYGSSIANASVQNAADMRQYLQPAGSNDARNQALASMYGAYGMTAPTSQAQTMPGSATGAYYDPNLAANSGNAAVQAALSDALGGISPAVAQARGAPPTLTGEAQVVNDATAANARAAQEALANPPA